MPPEKLDNALQSPLPVGLYPIAAVDEAVDLVEVVRTLLRRKRLIGFCLLFGFCVGAVLAWRHSLPVAPDYRFVTVLTPGKYPVDGYIRGGNYYFDQNIQEPALLAAKLRETLVPEFSKQSRYALHVDFDLRQQVISLSSRGKQNDGDAIRALHKQIIEAVRQQEQTLLSPLIDGLQHQLQQILQARQQAENNEARQRQALLLQNIKLLLRRVRLTSADPVASGQRLPDRRLKPAAVFMLSLFGGLFAGMAGVFVLEFLAKLKTPPST